MGEFIWGFIIGAALVGGVFAFLWRRGAVTIDKLKAKEGIDNLVDDARGDVKNWRDKLGK